MKKVLTSGPSVSPSFFCSHCQVKIFIFHKLFILGGKLGEQAINYFDVKNNTFFTIFKEHTRGSTGANNSTHDAIN